MMIRNIACEIERSCAIMNKIGIDAGGTLIKIAYEENQSLHVKTYPNQEIDQLVQWLKLVSPDSTLHLTGGKSSFISMSATQHIEHMEEFQALVNGTRYLLEQEGHEQNEEYVVVNIGTGTSIFHVTGNTFSRITGTGIGGGTLMGLGSLISGQTKFTELVKLASLGNHEQSDLLVKDIYATDAPLIGNITAANFGKAHAQEVAIEDHMAALIQLIGEAILLLAGQVAQQKNVKRIVFVGGALNGNKPLQHVLSRFQDMIPYQPIFLEKGAFAGAIGALLA